MLLTTEQGEFDSFQRLRGAYVEAMHEDLSGVFAFSARGTTWEQTKLHFSEIGQCPRRQLMRLSEHYAGRSYATQPKTRSQLDNDAMMFASSNFLHWLTYAAAEWAGILVSYERRLIESDLWTGVMGYEPQGDLVQRSAEEDGIRRPPPGPGYREADRPVLLLDRRSHRLARLLGDADMPRRRSLDVDVA